jgi:hypothetical protein
MTMLSRCLEYIVENSTLFRRLMMAVLALLVIVDLMVPSYYNRFPWEGISGFGAFYGFVSCIVILVVSKALGYALLYRRENYYDEQ